MKRLRGGGGRGGGGAGIGGGRLGKERPIGTRSNTKDEKMLKFCTLVHIPRGIYLHLPIVRILSVKGTGSPLQEKIVWFLFNACQSFRSIAVPDGTV